MTHALLRHGDTCNDPQFPTVQRRGPPPEMWAELEIDGRAWVVVDHKQESRRHTAVVLVPPRTAAFFRRSAR